MGRIIGFVVVGCTGAIWYVVANGIGDDYRPLGANGPVLPGRQIVLIAVAGLLGVLCLVSGLARSSVSSVLAGVLLLGCAVSALPNAAPPPESTTGGSLSDELQAAAACRHLLDGDPELASRLLRGKADAAAILADAARARGTSWSDADRECLAQVGAAAVDR